MRNRITLRRTLAISRKELHHIFRSPINLFLVAIAPAFLLLTLGYVYSLDIEHVNLMVLDYDRSEVSRAYISRLTSSDSFSIVGNPTDYDSLDELLIAGKADAGIIIPPDFAETMESAQRATVQVLVDGSNPLVAGPVLRQISGASEKAVAKLMPAPTISAPFEVRGRAWYNPNLKSLVSFVPGLLAVVLSMPALALSLSLAREKELGTLEGLVATPMHGGEYLLGKMSAYLLIGIVGVLLSWAVAVWWFRVPFLGSLGLFIGLTAIYYFAMMGFSLVVSAWLKSQQTALFAVLMVYFVPSFFLTGLFFPIDRTQTGAWVSAMVLPATHYITIARGIFLKGTGMQFLVFPTVALLIMGVSSLIIGVAAFKKRVG